MTNEIFKVGYTNYRGEFAVRRIIPTGIKYGSTPHHPEEQWLLDCFDFDKAAPRTYALKDLVQVPNVRPEDLGDYLTLTEDHKAAAPAPVADAFPERPNIEVLFGPAGNICWTQDHVKPEEREMLYLVRASDLDRIAGIMRPPKQVANDKPFAIMDEVAEVYRKQDERAAAAAEKEPVPEWACWDAEVEDFVNRRTGNSAGIEFKTKWHDRRFEFENYLTYCQRTPVHERPYDPTGGAE